jgi:N-methylhydantoinase B
VNQNTTSARRDRFRPRTDPITFEVLRHRIWQVNDEQGKTLLNMSGSQIATEANDFNVGIADAAGNLIVVGAYILNQLAPLTLLVQNAVRILGDDIAEGDMFLCNDPWFGCVHQNDVCVLAPFFWEGKLTAWTASVIHQVDVGGMSPGSWCHSATETWQEAPRYRYLRVVRQGRLQREVVDTYLTNSRAPDLVELDLRAQVGSATATLERLGAVLARYGRDTVIATMADMLDYSERLMQDKLENIPEGEWLADCYNDHDGKAECSHRYAVRLRKDPGTLTFDYRETDPQVQAFINCPWSGLLSATYTGLLLSLCSDIPWNSGLMRCVRILSDEGALNNARFPVAVSGSLESIWNSANVSAAALGKMLASSPTERHNAMAVWQGASMVYATFGQNRAGENYAGWMVFSGLGGGGARAYGDGHDNAGTIMSPRYSVINVETAESLYPMLFLYRKRAPDSGGPGRWRGGVGADSAVTPHGTAQMTVRLTTSGTDHSHTTGLWGGYPGGGSIARIARGALPEDGQASGAALPADWSEVAGDAEYLPSKAVLALAAGDILSTIPHGGGGFGDPLSRDPEQVRDDVLEGCVSVEAAAQVYGVVLSDTDWSVDAGATARRRDAIRAERLGRKPTREAGNAGLIGASRETGRWTCSACGHVATGTDGELKSGLLSRRRPVGDAATLAARRTDGESRTMELVEYACPECATLTVVDQRPRSESAPWHDIRPD